ncbi:MAG: Lpg1974 family pore-forming outer membrane protein [Chlamydiae bacterium]|nr:Lpg1974 family pore-forming outer membrane protein [Chlamydiota bacterium]
MKIYQLICIAISYSSKLKNRQNPCTALFTFLISHIDHMQLRIWPASLLKKLKHRSWSFADFLIYLSIMPILAVSHAKVEEEEHLFVTREKTFTNLEFLYWTIEEDALDYAISMKSGAWGPSPAFAKGKVKNGKFDWSPGFRVSLGYYNSPKYWELLGQYTWFYNKGSNKTKKPSPADHFLIATWNEITPPPLEKATSRLHFHHHLIDLLIARVFDPNPHLRLKLAAGAVACWIRQNWRIQYTNFNQDSDKIKNFWRFTGGGFRVGLSADWFWRFFYLTGKATFATLIGSYKNRAFQTTTFNPLGQNDPNISIRNSHYRDFRFALNTQFLLGPSYQKAFNNWDIEIFAGYEFNLWFNLQEVYRSSQSGPSSPKETFINDGLIGLHGLTIRLTLGF